MNIRDGSTPGRAIPLPYDPTRIAPWARAMGDHPGVWFIYRTGHRAHYADVARYLTKHVAGVETHTTCDPRRGIVIAARMAPA